MPLIGDDAANPSVATTFDRVRSTIGRIPNLYRVLGHSPEILDAWLAFAWPLRNAAKVDRALRELVIMRVAQLNATDYEWRQHWSMALEAGVTGTQLNDLANWPYSDSFSLSEKAALRMADEITANVGLSDPAWVELRGHFDDQECVELVLTGSFYACVSRVLEGLQVPLEDSAANVPPVDMGAMPHLFSRG